ncbi:MAG: hypothetical protein IPK03_09815 [Bacteroidetes bacterium]|nr:hypothetical protein [Bacteroidota bacterium]
MHNIVLMADGTAYGFGYNAIGQLGLGNTVSQTQPTKILKGAYSGMTYLGDNSKIQWSRYLQVSF